MFGGSTQSSGALELLRFISLGPLGSQGLPVMKGMLRKEFFFFFFFFFLGSGHYFFNLGKYMSRGMFWFSLFATWYVLPMYLPWSTQRKEFLDPVELPQESLRKAQLQKKS